MAALQSTTQQSNSGKSESCRHLTVGYLPGSARSGTDPHIRIAGRWVKEAGFPIGAKVSVEVARGRLVIELAPPSVKEIVEVPAPQRPYISERMAMTIDPPTSKPVAKVKKGGKGS